MLGFNWWTRFDWTMAIDFLSQPQKKLSIQVGACSKRVNYPRLKLRPCWATRKCRWMHESRTGIEFRGIGIGIGFLSNTNNICLRLMVAKWGAKRPSKNEKRTEENKKRTWGGVCSVYVIWQQVTERQRHRKREIMTVLIGPETETRHY